jgi:formate-dependent nitrite reductase membrane component NrfD
MAIESYASNPYQFWEKVVFSIVAMVSFVIATIIATMIWAKVTKKDTKEDKVKFASNFQSVIFWGTCLLLVVLVFTVGNH